MTASAVRTWLADMRCKRPDATTLDAADDRGASRLRLLLAIALGLTIALVTAAYLATQREAALRDAEREVRNLSLVLADWVGDGFRSIEQLQVSVTEWLRAEEIGTPAVFHDRLATYTAHEALRARAATMPKVDRFLIADAGGRLVTNSVFFPVPDINLSGRDYFEALRGEAGPDTFLSEPLQNRLNGEWTIFVARRIRGENGVFLGIVGAAISLRRFEAFFSRLALGLQSSITLARRDGVLLARHPWMDNAIGTSAGTNQTFTRLLPGAKSGVFRGFDSIDGTERVFGTRAIEGYPLVVVATRATDEVLAAWRREAWRIGIAAALLEGLVLAGLLVANHQGRNRTAMRRLRAASAAAKAELSLSHEREVAARILAERDGALRAVFETGTAGIAEVDATKLRFIRVNDRFCAMSGRSEAELTGGLGPADVVHPDDWKADLARWHAVEVAGGIHEAEIRYLHPDGSILWVRLSVAVSARDSEGRPTRCVAVAQDVTESRTATERLRTSEEMLRVGQAVGQIGSFRRDFPTGAIHCSRETRQIFGVSAVDEPLPPGTWMSVIVPEDRERLAELMRDTIARQAPTISCDYRIQRPTDGELRHIEMRARYQFDSADQLVGSVGVVIDVTERREAEERLRASEAMLRLGMEVGRIGTYTRGADGIIRCGAETRTLHGLPEGTDPIPTDAWLETILPGDRSRMLAESTEARARGVPEASFHYRICRPLDGKTRHIEARVRYEYDAAGRTAAAVGVVVDVTEAYEAEALLRLSLEIGRIGIFRHNFATREVELSPEALAMYGLPAEAVMMTTDAWFEMLHPEDRGGVIDRLRVTAEKRALGMAVNFRVIRACDASLCHVEARTRYEYDADGHMVSALGVLIDVTERHEAEARMAHIAHHDALTGLPNRVLFRERLDGALARARRGEGFALLCLDLDRFKEVNDTLGHPVGDALLRAVVGRLKAELRETDTFARLGGDEFAVVQVSVDQPRDATALARRLVEVVSAPFDLDGHHVSVGTSVGIAVAPADGLDPDALLKAADMALYRAKSDGRGTWRFFEPEMDVRMQMRRALELDLRRALTCGEFEVHYQPIVSVADRQVTGLEALVRWRHPGRGLVSPDRFVPLCEEIGLIGPLGEWVLTRACADAAAWPGKLRIAVNLSPAQFASPGLVDVVTSALQFSGLEPGRLELEITETVMLRETEATLATLHQLKAIGVRIAMDDFGTGYSSLSYLQRFPFDKVKIDQSFTRELDHSHRSNAIIGAVTDLCLGLNMTTTAEGVETEEQFSALARKGCIEAQGFLFSKPLLAGDVPAALTRLAAAARNLESRLASVH